MGRTRTRRRSSGKAARKKSPFFDVPFYTENRNHWPPMEAFSAEHLDQLHNASMQILERTGIRFMDEEAMDLWEAAGAKVDRDTQHVWPDRNLLMSLVAKAPSSFTLHGRNPARSRTIGENNITFFPGAGMVFMRDLDRGRRPGERRDMVTLAKLCQMSNMVHMAPLQGVVMHDVEVNDKHLETARIIGMMTDKPAMSISHGRIIASDGVEMMRILHGGGELTPEKGPITGGVINVNSPLVYDDRMLGGMMTFAKHGQFTVVTPFILAGAMSPITIQAALAQHNAEALAGIALLQLVRPGAPCIYGGFTTNVDMRSGSPAFGTPEGAWAHLVGGQLARRYGLPFRGSGGLNTANVPDGQSSAESMWSLWPCIMAHTNLIFHSCGWLEAGLTVSLEKYVMDLENLAMMQHFLRGPSWEGDIFALDSIDKVGPAGHHFGTQHTQDRFATAFYPAFLHDRRNVGTWTEAGSEDIVKRANTLWKEIVANYEAPHINPDAQAELEAFIERRRSELVGIDLYD